MVARLEFHVTPDDIAEWGVWHFSKEPQYEFYRRDSILSINFGFVCGVVLGFGLYLHELGTLPFDFDSLFSFVGPITGSVLGSYIWYRTSYSRRLRRIFRRQAKRLANAHGNYELDAHEEGLVVLHNGKATCVPWDNICRFVGSDKHWAIYTAPHSAYVIPTAKLNIEELERFRATLRMYSPHAIIDWSTARDDNDLGPFNLPIEKVYRPI